VARSIVNKKNRLDCAPAQFLDGAKPAQAGHTHAISVAAGYVQLKGN
jgi:hypothetical protein